MAYRRDPKSRAIVLEPEPQDQRIENLKRVVGLLIQHLERKGSLSFKEFEELSNLLREV